MGPHGRVPFFVSEGLSNFYSRISMMTATLETSEHAVTSSKMAMESKRSQLFIHNRCRENEFYYGAGNLASVSLSRHKWSPKISIQGQADEYGLSGGGIRCATDVPGDGATPSGQPLLRQQVCQSERTAEAEP